MHTLRPLIYVLAFTIFLSNEFHVDYRLSKSDLYICLVQIQFQLTNESTANLNSTILSSE